MKLGDLGHWFGGGTPSKSRAEFWTDGDIPWVSPKDMKTPIITSALDHITEAAVKRSSTSLVPPGSVLVVVRSGILKHTLPVAITAREVALNQDLKAVTPNPDVLPEYLALGLKAFERKILDQCCKDGTTVQNIKMPSFLRFEMPIAPLPEQRRIVARIEELFSRLDAGLAALHQAKAQLKRYRQSVLTAAVTGQFTTSWRAKNANAESGSDLLKRILKIRREQHRGNSKYKEPEQKLDIAMLRVIPAGWVWATFEQVSKRVTVGHVGSMKDEYADSGVPFLRGQNIRANRFDPKGLKYVSKEFHAQLNKSRTLPGDIAVTRSGEVGVACVIPDHIGEVNCSDLVLVQQPIEILPEFACYFMNSIGKRLVEKGSVGVAITHFNTQAVAAMPLPLPPVAEQRIIVAEVEARASSIDHIENEIEIKLQHCANLRTAILMAAFSDNL